MNMYLFPFQTESDIQLLGFFLTRAAFRQACLLRKRFLLVLDLDETLGTSNEDFGLQVSNPFDCSTVPNVSWHVARLVDKH